MLDTDQDGDIHLTFQHLRSRSPYLVQATAATKQVIPIPIRAGGTPLLWGMGNIYQFCQSSWGKFSSSSSASNCKGILRCGQNHTGETHFLSSPTGPNILVSLTGLKRLKYSAEQGPTLQCARHQPLNIRLRPLWPPRLPILIMLPQSSQGLNQTDTRKASPLTSTWKS